MDYESHLNKGHILCRAILEIVGAPKEHIESSLKDYVEKLKGAYDIISEEFAETTEKDKMFSTFVEIELWIEGITDVFDFCIQGLPSSIEIVEPAKFNISAPDLSGSLNDFMAKIHAVDMAVKNSNAKVTLVEKNAYTLATNIIGLALKDKPLDIKSLEKETGIGMKKLEEFLGSMVKSRRILREGDYYKLK